ncbi:HD domain-containing protein [Sulfurimonas lithotrophica]|uniref:HD domain-containing protein n=1 Tax=Sulfurimonas lithotrophica TaxID=2590022 RepID=A0A5P8P3F8_9BACT|nr:HD domain-containing phosphohydrolase [Sulfurimonas lithotrophica]QFR50229.1 HD domain-containing protein [Sulfurimonas lithotrophica]
MLIKVKKGQNIDKYQIALDTINKDVILPYDMYIEQDDSTIAVKAGTLIDDKIYDVLQSQKAVFIPKKYVDLRKNESKNLETYISYAKHNPEYCINYLYKMNDIFFDNFLKSSDNLFDFEDVESMIKAIILLIRHNRNFVKENIIHFQNDNMLAHHSLHVAIYAVNLGISLEIQDKKLLSLGMAGYLQDIGIKKVDNNIVLKDSKLSADEIEDIHKHAMYSTEIIKHNHIHNPHIIEAIMHHHENYDGSGYPNHLKKGEISIFASILSICDVFDALTSTRPYRKEMSSFEALTYMMKDEQMRNRFNHQYIKIFITLLVKK